MYWASRAPCGIPQTGVSMMKDVIEASSMQLRCEGWIEMDVTVTLLSTSWWFFLHANGVIICEIVWYAVIVFKICQIVHMIHWKLRVIMMPTLSSLLSIGTAGYHADSGAPIDLLHNSHNAPVPYLTMHHFVTEMCMCPHFCYKMVHFGIFIECIVGFVRKVYRVGW